jgi:hypothetical protein
VSKSPKSIKEGRSRDGGKDDDHIMKMEVKEQESRRKQRDRIEREKEGE